MNEHPRSPADTSADSLPAWLQPTWDGPAVELRPAEADASWPEGAHHRVVFVREKFPQYRCWPAPTRAYAQHFTEDGWPLEIPADIRPQLEARAQEFFHRTPWSNYAADWSRAVILNDFVDMEGILDIEENVKTFPRTRIPPPP